MCVIGLLITWWLFSNLCHWSHCSLSQCAFTAGDSGLVILQPSQSWHKCNPSLTKYTLIYTELIQVCVFVCVCGWWMPVCVHTFLQIWQQESVPDVGRFPPADLGTGGSDGMAGEVCQPVRGHGLRVQTAQTMQVKPKAVGRKYHESVPILKLMSHYKRFCFAYWVSIWKVPLFWCLFNSLWPISFHR